MTEHREHPRYAIELDAELHFDDERISGRTRDVSKGGFCMLTTRALPLGATCEVRLALVFSENQFSEQLQLPATVVWSTPTQGQYQVGIKFAPMEAQNTGYLSLFIQFLESGDTDDEVENDASDDQEEP